MVQQNCFIGNNRRGLSDRLKTAGGLTTMIDMYRTGLNLEPTDADRVISAGVLGMGAIRLENNPSPAASVGVGSPSMVDMLVTLSEMGRLPTDTLSRELLVEAEKCINTGFDSVDPVLQPKVANLLAYQRTYLEDQSRDGVIVSGNDILDSWNLHIQKTAASPPQVHFQQLQELRTINRDSRITVSGRVISRVWHNEDVLQLFGSPDDGIQQLAVVLFIPRQQTIQLALFRPLPAISALNAMMDSLKFQVTQRQAEVHGDNIVARSTPVRSDKEWIQVCDSVRAAIHDNHG